MTKKTKLFRIKFSPDPTYGALDWSIKCRECNWSARSTRREYSTAHASAHVMKYHTKEN